MSSPRTTTRSSSAAPRAARRPAHARRSCVRQLVTSASIASATSASIRCARRRRTAGAPWTTSGSSAHRASTSSRGAVIVVLGVVAEPVGVDDQRARQRAVVATCATARSATGADLEHVGRIDLLHRDAEGLEALARMLPARLRCDGVLCDQPLSSSTISSGSRQSEARLSVSYTMPSPSVPSPMNTELMASLPES